MTTTLNGQLEVDCERGVIYFHTTERERPTVLRICNLDRIPTNFEFIDITHLHGLWIEPTPPYDYTIPSGHRLDDNNTETPTK